MDKIEQIIRERPSFHRSETEIERDFDPGESLLPRRRLERLAAAGLTCYGLRQEALSFIAASVADGSRTLETGAGCSTLVFALRGAHHIAVTPSQDEIGRIRRYAGDHGIALDRVTFVAESSDAYLPRSDAQGLDLVLLDGKHAFPWPMVDWFFTADRLRKGGIMVIDDAHLRPVAILAEFMAVDPGWEKVEDFEGKTLAFRKARDSVHDVAWHMQPFATVAGEGLLRRLKRRLRGLARRER